MRLLPVDFFGHTLVLTAGASFDVLTGTSLNGDFASFDLPTLGAGLGWSHQVVITTGAFGILLQTYRLTVSAVPDPGSAAMLLAGLLATVAMTRRKRPG